MSPPTTIRSWTRKSTTKLDKTFLLSTAHSLVDLEALSSAFESDLLYWAKPLSPSQLKLCVESSLCLGLYVTENDDCDGDVDNGTCSSNGGSATPRQMIGFARLVTDYVTFGYLTDVYVLPEFQGQGLARWMMVCLDEMLRQWPDLRRCLLFTRDQGVAKMYGSTMKFREIGNGHPAGFIMMERGGPGIGWNADGSSKNGEDVV